MSAYPAPWFRADVVAGLTTAAVVIPKVMAYGAIAGLPIEIGLYTALIPLVVYAALGTSRATSVTTTSAIASLTAGALQQVAPAGDSAQLIAAAAALTAGVGAALLIASFLKLGFLADFISLPVLTGFKAGLAIFIIVGQIPKLLGIHFTKGSFLEDAVSIVRHLPDASVATLAVAVTVMAIVIGIQWALPKAPSALIAVTLSIVASGVLGLERAGVELVGRVPSGLPSFALPDLALAQALWPAALGIALMTFVQTIASGRAFVQPGEPLPEPNRELLALGLANLGGSLFHNMPSGGATTHTAVNRAAGARTQVAGIVTAAMTLATLLFLAPLVALLPHAALAAVVVVISASLFQPAEFAEIRQVRQLEFWWAVAAALSVVLLGTLQGVLVAVALSMLVLFYRANRPPVYVLGHRQSTNSFEPLSPSDTREELQTWPGLLVLRTEGRVYFANASRIGERLWQFVHEAKPQVVILDMSAVPDLEYTALKALTVGEEKLRSAGTILWLAALNSEVRGMIERAPLGRVLGSDRIFVSLTQAVNAYAGQKAS